MKSTAGEMADIDNAHHGFSACNKIRYISLYLILSNHLNCTVRWHKSGLINL